ncbi:hypothetical protein K0B96_06590 [Horticoccus luteus]|uniref:DUF3486 family protein n=1 Tax=Horticoccus luteus TaxID=2862869 RepID=A0A8F9TYE5_9BACT|nr:hypothetical protein [Horticoccus luteus]QYM80277.1 hypothetical protein K0B96_06590 [Horticoccus luteus]
MSRKRRSDAKLHALPEPVKEQLIRWLTEENVSYEKAKERLEMDFNVRVSVGALCDFYATECYLQTSASAQEFVTRVEAEVRADGRAYDAATLALIRQRAYLLARTQGASVNDLATLAGIIGDTARLELRQRELTLSLDKFRHQVKSDIEKGLDALHAEIKGHADALQLFERMKAIVMHSVEGTS